MNTAMFCDFCGKHQDYVQQLIAGPKVHICDECIEICAEIVAKAKAAKTSDTPPKPSKE